MSLQSQWLDKDFIRELEALRRRLLISARSAAGGERLSRRRGASAEFEDHRPYTPGDDPRRLDWAAYARTGEPVIKLFRAEEDVVARVLVDGSASMSFGEPSKFQAAQRLAAAIAYMSLAGSERAQLVAAAEKTRVHPAGRGRGALPKFFQSLERLQAQGPGDLARSIDAVIQQERRAGILAVISDFFDSGPMIGALKRAKMAGHDIALVQVLAPQELQPDFEGDLALVDAETGDEVEVTIDDAALEAYALRLAGLCEELRAFARSYGASYVRVTSDGDLPQAVRRMVNRGVDLAMKLPFSLQSPTGLWLLAACVPLVLLYVLKVRRKKQTIASTWLWAAAKRDMLARSPFKRLVAQVPLFLQLLTLLLLAFALAGPTGDQKDIVGDHLAIVIDSSASMAALDPTTKKTRHELAKEAAKEIIRGLTPGTDALIIQAGRHARIASPLDRDPRRLARAVDKLRVEQSEGHLRRSLALAVDRMGQLGGARTVVVITDGNWAQSKSISGIAMPVRLIKVGTPIQNVAIVRVDVRAGRNSQSKKEQVQAFALVANFGTHPRDLFVTLRLANTSQPLTSRRIYLKGGERLPVVLTFDPSPGDRRQGLVVDISPHDYLKTDDTAYARVPAGRILPVVLHGNDTSPWLKRALGSDPLVQLYKAKSKSAGGRGALHVYDGSCPKRQVSGDMLIVHPPKGPCLQTTIGAEVESPSITSWANGDRRLRFLTFDGVHVAKANGIEVGSPSRSLVRSQHHTLIADASMAGRANTIVGFDVGESNWPLRASFVLFVRNILEQARNHRNHGVVGAVRAGSPMRVPVSGDVDAVKVRYPGERNHRSVPARGGLAVVSDTGALGHYLVSWQGSQPGSSLVPVNLVSEKESNLKPQKVAITSSVAKTKGQPKPKGGSHHNWGYVLALVALAIIAADVFWLTRKPKARIKLTPVRPDRPATPNEVRS